MFGLMTEREHKDLMLSMECDLQYQQQKNKILCERIQLGEEYRAQLEMEITSLKAPDEDPGAAADAGQL